VQELGKRLVENVPAAWWFAALRNCWCESAGYVLTLGFARWSRVDLDGVGRRFKMPMRRRWRMDERKEELAAASVIVLDTVTHLNRAGGANGSRRCD